MTILGQLWNEKYRPKKIEEVILSDKEKNIFKKYISENDIPNLLFKGPQGSGKTTVALILCSPTGVLQNSENYLFVNGSSQECRSINFTEGVIIPYLKTPPSEPDNKKIMFVDEADNMTSDNYRSLRGHIEKFQKSYGRFIFTCNYPHVIPEAIRSRFTDFVFERIPIEFVKNFCRDILIKEKVEYKEEDLIKLIEIYYPDIRKTINELEKFCYGEPEDKENLLWKLEFNSNDLKNIETEIINSFIGLIRGLEKDNTHEINFSIKSIKNIIEKESFIPYQHLYSSLFYSTNIPPVAKVLINEYANKHNQCFVPQMHFMAMIFEVFKSLKEYKSLILKKK